MAGSRDLIVWLLKQRPDAVNIPNQDGRTLLHLAALNNQIEICKVIMDHGAFVNPIMRNARGQLLTPLDAALHRGNRGCAKYLQLYGGVPASKITDKNALQKALVRAFSESQGEKLLPPTTAQQQLSQVASSQQQQLSAKAAVTPEPTYASAGNQTAAVAMESKLIQSTIVEEEKQDVAVQMEAVESLTKESQTSPINFGITENKEETADKELLAADKEESQGEQDGVGATAGDDQEPEGGGGGEEAEEEEKEDVGSEEGEEDGNSSEPKESEIRKEEAEDNELDGSSDDEDDVGLEAAADAMGKSPSQGDHIVLEDEAKERLQRAREERKKFFEEERRSQELLDEEEERKSRELLEEEERKRKQLEEEEEKRNKELLKEEEEKKNKEVMMEEERKRKQLLEEEEEWKRKELLVEEEARKRKEMLEEKEERKREEILEEEEEMKRKRQKEREKQQQSIKDADVQEKIDERAEDKTTSAAEPVESEARRKPKKDHRGHRRHHGDTSSDSSTASSASSTAAPVTASGSRRPSRRSLDEMVRERYEEDWSVREMRAASGRKKRRKAESEAAAMAAAAVAATALSDQAELIATNVCTKLETELTRMASRSQELLAADIEAKSAQVQEILRTVEEVKLFVSQDMEKKTAELQQAIELAENTHRLIAELQARTLPQEEDMGDDVSPRRRMHPRPPAKVMDDKTASEIITRARRVRQEFYLSEEKSSERQYTYTEEEDSEQDDNDDNDNDDDDEVDDDNTDSQVSEIVESQPGK